MLWNVLFCDEFDDEFQLMAEGLQNELLAHALLLRDYGPALGRPAVDTLNGSEFANMKELRFNWKGEVWRVAFAFDPQRQAVFLVGGDKAGADQKRFYRRLVKMADERYRKHLALSDTSQINRKGGKHGKKP
jgi:hypothetical protein